jgi:hypothetical protein
MRVETREELTHISRSRMQGFPHSYEQRIDEGGAVGWGHSEHVDADRCGGTMKALPNAMKLREEGSIRSIKPHETRTPMSSTSYN